MRLLTFSASAMAVAPKANKVGPKIDSRDVVIRHQRLSNGLGSFITNKGDSQRDRV